MDRITRLRIGNIRAFEDLDLALGPFTVLLGENGSGKSTILEALELLHKAAEPSFFQQFYAIHRGMPGLLRKGKTSLRLGLVIEDDAGTLPRLEYEFTLSAQQSGAAVHSERLLVMPADDAPPVLAFDRIGARVTASDLVVVPDTAYADQLVITSFGPHPSNPLLDRLLTVLRGIEVHLRFDTLATWAARSYGLLSNIRGSVTLQPADRLALLGLNLATAWSALQNLDSKHWEQTMALVRLGLGEAIDSVNILVDAAGGNVALALRRTDMREPIPAANLSDGQLSWLAFVALARLGSTRSLLAIDEPELHLHPSLLGRVVSLLTSLGTPVIVSTHADRVLEVLDDPASAVRVCTPLPGGAATVAHIDADELPRWLEKFGDLARLNASGYLERVLVRPTPRSAGEP